MRKLIPLIVLVIYANHSPECIHLDICADDRSRCLSSTQIELSEPISEIDDPLMVEAKILVREAEAGQGKEFDQAEIKTFFNSKPEFGTISTDIGVISLPVETPVLDEPVMP